MIVQAREQHPNLGVRAHLRRRLQRAQRVVHASGVHGCDAGALEQGRIVGHRRQALVEQKRRLVRASLRQRAPAPRLEAAAHVLAARGARGALARGLAEPLAGPRELPRGIEADRVVGQRGDVRGGARDHDGGLRRGRADQGPPGGGAHGEESRDQDRKRETGGDGDRHADGPQRGGSSRKSGCPYSTGWPFSTRTFRMRPAAFDSISFISFIASMMQRIWPSFTTSPSLRKSGTWTTAPVSSVARLVPPCAVSPRRPGSVLAMASSTKFGTSTVVGTPSMYRTSTSVFSFRYSRASPTSSADSETCS